jgi:hypothetical protein
MKFRFAGNLDVPDWLLAEIAVLAPLSTNTCNILCNVVVQQIKTSTLNYKEIEQLTTTEQLKSCDVKGVVAALNYILRNACKYGVDPHDLETEVQQLGLTKDAATKVTQHYVTSKESLVTVLQSNTLAMSDPNAIEWRVDCVLGSSAEQTNQSVCVQMRLSQQRNNEHKTSTSFEVDSDLFKLLHEELKNARKQMMSLN